MTQHYEIQVRIDGEWGPHSYIADETGDVREVLSVARVMTKRVAKRWNYRVRRVPVFAGRHVLVTITP
jgi:hypothetical protein